jgi:hypothetical protein
VSYGACRRSQTEPRLLSAQTGAAIETRKCWVEVSGVPGRSLIMYTMIHGRSGDRPTGSARSWRRGGVSSGGGRDDGVRVLDLIAVARLALPRGSAVWSLADPGNSIGGGDIHCTWYAYGCILFMRASLRGWGLWTGSCAFN